MQAGCLRYLRSIAGRLFPPPEDSDEERVGSDAERAGADSSFAISHSKRGPLDYNPARFDDEPTPAACTAATLDFNARKLDSSVAAYSSAFLNFRTSVRLNRSTCSASSGFFRNAMVAFTS